MVTLAQFREITEGLPGDFEIRIEACFTPEGNKTAPCFEMMYSKGTKEVVLLPEAVHISDGETGLTVKHEEKPRSFMAIRSGRAGAGRANIQTSTERQRKR